MKRFRVDRVENSNNFTSSNGPMIGWRLACTNLDTGGTETIEINSKPNNSYQVGQEFYATEKGGEYQGAKKYKREAPPREGAAPAAAAARNGNGAPAIAAARPARPAVPYEQAIQLWQRLVEDVGAEDSRLLFDAILRGAVTPPEGVTLEAPKPPTTVRWMGNTIETKGITQEQFDRAMALREQVDAKFGKNTAKALLIAEMGVDSSKELDEVRGATFLEALGRKLASYTPPPSELPTDDDVPF